MAGADLFQAGWPASHEVLVGSPVGGRSSVVEFQPSKLAVVGSNPIARSN